MSTAVAYDRAVNERATRYAAIAAEHHQGLVRARERAQALQTERNAALLAAWHEGAEMAEPLAHLDLPRPPS